MRRQHGSCRHELSLFGKDLSADKSLHHRDTSIHSVSALIRRLRQNGYISRFHLKQMTRRTQMQQFSTRMRRTINTFLLGAAVTMTLSAQSVTTTVSENASNSSRTTTVTGANGKTATYENNAAWGNGSYTDNKTVTGFNGKTASSNTSASYAPGSTSRQTTVTGFNGQSATYNNNRSWGSGTYSDTASYRGFNGVTRSDTVTRSNGMVQNTYTGRNGNSRTVTRLARFRR